MKANKKSLYQEGGSVDKESINPVVNELSAVIKSNIENGGSPEEVLKTFLLQGIPVDQLTIAFESAGYDPGAFGELLQNVEIMMAQEEQAQQPEQQVQEQMPPSMMQPENIEQPQMQFGGGTNVSSGFLSQSPQDKRPIYMPPVPAKGNLLGAAFLLDDAAGRLFSGEDANNDGVMDGTFRDWSAKRARYKKKQLGNRSYTVDYKGLDPADYAPNWEDLADLTETKFSKFFKGKKERERINQVQNTGLQTKEEFAENIFKNSLVNFDPETNNYTGVLASDEEDYDVLGKKTKIDLGLLGPKKERKFKDPSSWFGREEAPLSQNANSFQNVVERLNQVNDIDSEMMIEAATNYESGQGLNANRSSYDKSLLSPEEYVKAQADYRNIMLGNIPMESTNPANFITNTPSKVTKTEPVEPEQQQRSVVELPREEVTSTPEVDSYKDWAKKNQVRLQLKGLTTEAQQRAVYEAESEFEFKYGGDYLPKAQMLGEFDPNNPFGLPDFSQMGQTSYINPATGQPWTAGTPSTTPSTTPLQDQQPVYASGPGSGMGSMFLDQQAFQQELDALNTSLGDAEESTATALGDAQEPTVKRKRTVGNALKQAKTFIKENPSMRAFGDVSDFVVKGANMANELFTQAKFYDYKNELRNSTMADKVYLATENPVNKRGTFDANLGLAEPDNLVDYYAQAMYGKETYKSGGEFEPHMMFDPVSGKGYKANVESDHNRYAKLGFLHQDEMQKGGEVEIDNDTLAALIAAGADIEIL